MPKPSIAPYAAAEHRAATLRGQRTASAPTAVMDARYDADAGDLVLHLRNGARVALPVAQIPELHGQSAAQLAHIEVFPLRDGLFWPSIDVAISAPGLLADFFGSAFHAKLDSAGGSRATARRAAGRAQRPADFAR